MFPGFAFSYHGRDQRELKEQFARLYEPCFRDQPPPAGSGLRDRKRIGILVTRRHEGMFLQSMRGIIERLDGERFELVVLCSRAIRESLRAGSAARDLRFVPFGDSLRDAIRQVRAAACDLIYYSEVGSDAMNYFLPFARLAPVQCTGWGSTITSGVPAVDWFLSSELVETPGSEAQYTERLWQSRTLFAIRTAAAPRRGIRRRFRPAGRPALVRLFSEPVEDASRLDRALRRRSWPPIRGGWWCCGRPQRPGRAAAQGAVCAADALTPCPSPGGRGEKSHPGIRNPNSRRDALTPGPSPILPGQRRRDRLPAAAAVWRILPAACSWPT